MFGSSGVPGGGLAGGFEHPRSMNAHRLTKLCTIDARSAVVAPCGMSAVTGVPQQFIVIVTAALQF